MKPVRLFLWLALFFVVLCGLLVNQPSALMGLVPHPVTCSGSAPTWMDELAVLAGDLGYPGFQLAYQDAGGQRFDCVVGWSAFGARMERMQATHVMRYASLSKIFTSAVAMQLLAEGRLDLDAKLVGLLGLSAPFADPRIGDVTVAHLLNHTAGFDRSRTSDPMMAARPWCPGKPEALRELRLDHVPGTHYAYSNVGYCLLGAVISRVERAPLDAVYRRRLFEPSGLESIAVVQRNEVRSGETTPHFDQRESLHDLLDLDYASMLATGAWTGTAADLLNMLIHLFGREASLLAKHQQQRLLDVADTCDIGKWRLCHGYGFYKYREQGRQAMYWRDGSLPGVTSFVGVFEDGSIIVFLANSRRYGWMPDNDRLGQVIYRLHR